MCECAHNLLFKVRKSTYEVLKTKFDRMKIDSDTYYLLYNRGNKESILNRQEVLEWFGG